MSSPTREILATEFLFNNAEETSRLAKQFYEKCYNEDLKDPLKAECAISWKNAWDARCLGANSMLQDAKAAIELSPSAPNTLVLCRSALALAMGDLADAEREALNRGIRVYRI